MNESINIVCTLCSAINRIFNQRLEDNPICGKCKHSLFSASTVELDKTNFDRNVMRNQIPVIVDFWAPWCGPCKSMAPAFKQASAQLEPHFRLAKLNTEAEPEIASRFSIRSIPTMIFFKTGQELQRHSGAMGAEQIADWVKSVSQ